MTGKKRARKVCYRCHIRKVRCDLQARSSGQCTPCADANAPCQLRPSHKGRRLKPTAEASSSSVNQPGAKQERGLASKYLELDEITTGSEASLTQFEDLQASDVLVNDATIREALELFSDMCYPWCPVLEPFEEEEAWQLSPLLQQALTFLRSSIGSANAEIGRKTLLYSLFASITEGQGRLAAIQAAAILSLAGTSQRSGGLMSNFLLIGIAIRLAQDNGLHRQSKTLEIAATVMLHRRIWWTLYMRERFMSICQALPCSIDEDYCDIPRPTLRDFPTQRSLQAQLFLHAIDLASIVGHVSKQLIKSRHTKADLPTAEIASRLVNWLTALPATMQLSIASAYDGIFDRDVHLLHLPYLNAITLVYLYTSNEQLPQASVASVLAAGCTARILEDLMRSDMLILLAEEAGWYAATAALALMHVRPLNALATHATEHIANIQTFLSRMAVRWRSSGVLLAGIQRLLARTPAQSIRISTHQPAVVPITLDDLCAGDDVQWPNFFPFATVDTSPLIKAILVECQSTFPQLWLSTVPGGFDAFLDELQS